MLVVLCAMAIYAGPVQAITPCDSHGGTLDDLETPRQIKAFVHCAIAHIDAVGWEQAVTDFQTEGAWRHGATFLFASTNEFIVHFIAGSDTPPGTDLSDLRDIHDFPLTQAMERVITHHGSGYVYYHIENPVSGAIEPKTSYVTSTMVDGEEVYIGSGIYPQDVRGACDPDVVRASLVYTERDLEHYVRCAGLHIRTQGLRGLFDLAFDKRWNEGSMYIVLLDLETGMHVAGGAAEGSTRIGMDLSDLEDDTGYRLVEDMQRILQYQDEGYVYYRFLNPATGQIEPKTSFIKRLPFGGRDYILLAGIYGVTPACAANAAAQVDTRSELQLYVSCALDMIQARGIRGFDLFNFHPHWFSGSRYIFVVNEQCATIVYPIDYRAARMQAGGCDLEDVNGTKLMQDIWDTGTGPDGGGWTEYVWQNPGTESLETKISYVLGFTLEGETLVVGSGLYESDLTE